MGQYQRTNHLIPIIGKTADNWPIPIMGRLLVHLYLLLNSARLSQTHDLLF